MKGNLVEVDGANRADVRPDRGAGVVAAGQQPVGEHGAGGRGSTVSGLVISVHGDVQQRGEGPGRVVSPLPGR